MKKFLVTSCLVLTSASLFSQNYYGTDLFIPPSSSFPMMTLQTERPTANISPTLIPVGEVMVQSAALHMYGASENVSKWLSIYNQTVIRTGIAQNVELRFTSDLRRYASTNNHPFPYPGVNEITSISGFMPFRLGAKIKVFAKSKFFQNASVIGDFGFGTIASDGLRTPYDPHQVLFASAHELGKKWMLSYNLGLGWTGFDATTNALGSVAAIYKASPRFTLSTEVYGNTAYGNGPQAGVNAGASFAFLPELLVGIYGGYGHSIEGSYWYFQDNFNWFSGAIGVSYKFSYKKQK